MNFGLEWVIYLLAMLFYSIINNLFWINKGGEWYTKAEVSNKLGTWKGPVRDYSFEDKIDYAFKYRILGVLTNWRDWGSALITSFVLSIIL